jgi:hypothetical protein
VLQTFSSDIFGQKPTSAQSEAMKRLAQDYHRRAVEMQKSQQEELCSLIADEIGESNWRKVSSLFELPEKSSRWPIVFCVFR